MKFHSLLPSLLILFTFDCLSLDVQGHRGARAVLPENSLPAFQYALEIGVDTIELDTVVSRDDEVIVFHDLQINPKICRYNDGSAVTKTLWVRQLALDEIKRFDCGSQVNANFKQQKPIPGTQIPTLREVFELVSGSELPNSETVRFNIEIKSGQQTPQAQPKPSELANQILKLVDEFGLHQRVIIQSFDHRTLIATHALNPKIELAALFRENLDDWVTPTLAAKARVVSPRHTHLTKNEVETIQAAGLRVIPWTANTQRAWKRLIQMGVDGIITDDPLPLMQLIGRTSPVKQP